MHAKQLLVIGRELMAAGAAVQHLCLTALQEAREVTADEAGVIHMHIDRVGIAALGIDPSLDRGPSEFPVLESAPLGGEGSASETPDTGAAPPGDEAPESSTLRRRRR